MEKTEIVNEKILGCKISMKNFKAVNVEKIEMAEKISNRKTDVKKIRIAMKKFLVKILQ